MNIVGYGLEGAETREEAMFSAFMFYRLNAKDIIESKYGECSLRIIDAAINNNEESREIVGASESKNAYDIMFLLQIPNADIEEDSDEFYKLEELMLSVLDVLDEGEEILTDLENGNIFYFDGYSGRSVEFQASTKGLFKASEVVPRVVDDSNLEIIVSMIANMNVHEMDLENKYENKLENQLQEFNVPVKWEVETSIKVKAKSKEEAFNVVKNNSFDVPMVEGTNYVERSFSVIEEDIEKNHEENTEYISREDLLVAGNNMVNLIIDSFPFYQGKGVIESSIRLNGFQVNDIEEEVMFCFEIFGNEHFHVIVPLEDLDEYLYDDSEYDNISNDDLPF